MTSTQTDFDAAKMIFEQLKGVDKDRQLRILRWVSESLGIEVGPNWTGRLTFNHPARPLRGTPRRLLLVLEKVRGEVGGVALTKTKANQPNWLTRL